MVSTRPPPNPPQGRVAYPSTATYIPGDTGLSPGYITDPSSSTSHGLSVSPTGPDLFQVRSSGSNSASGELQKNTQGLRAWWSNFQKRQSSSSSSQSASSRGGGGSGGGGAPAGRPRAGTYLPPTQGERRVFGAQLTQAMQKAAAEISTGGPDGQLYVYGTVPLVVAKTGLRLKQHALEIEGVFRVSGSEKRTKELQEIFDSPPRFGKDIVWDEHPYNQYTPHDIATIFRRFLTLMPSPLIPPDYYQAFRSVLPDPSSDEALTVEQAVERFRDLIKSLPTPNQHLLLYVLDLLNMFAKRSDKNKMDASNLAVVFQPGILSDQDNDMVSAERMKSTAVLTFLIEQQDSFLAGIQIPRRKGRKSRKHQLPPPVTNATDSHYRDHSPEATSTGTSPLQPASPVSSPSPPPPQTEPGTWADADCIVPSDSDDEPPTGGYRIIETCPRPHSPLSPRPVPSIEASLLAPKTSRPSPQSALSPQSRSPRPLPVDEMFEPSDSDDDTPVGGYVIHTNLNRRTSLPARQSGGGFLGRSRTLKTRREEKAAIQAVAVVGTTGASGLARRSTLPAKPATNIGSKYRRLQEN